MNSPYNFKLSVQYVRDMDTKRAIHISLFHLMQMCGILYLLLNRLQAIVFNISIKCYHVIVCYFLSSNRLDYWYIELYCIVLRWNTTLVKNHHFTNFTQNKRNIKFHDVNLLNITLILQFFIWKMHRNINPCGLMIILI